MSSQSHVLKPLHRTALALAIIGVIGSATIASAASSIMHLGRGGQPPSAGVIENKAAPNENTGGNPGVLPPGSHAFGLSQGEWSAKWWQWAFSFRADAHPLLDTAGCDAGQSGPVWFLGGSFVNTTVVRECTVPAGKVIFFPVLNTECSTIEGPPFFGSNEAELRACAAAVTNTGMFATIDGVAVQNLSSYRVQSPLYVFSAPDGGLFGGPVSGAQSISDGVWLMLAPLSAGRTHTIHFGGTQTIPGFPSLTLDVTYNLRVVGQHGHHRGDHDDSEDPQVQASNWGLVKKLYK